jgi:hypothetical protein
MKHVTTWTATDYMNVADWVRIYGNSLALSQLLYITGVEVDFDFMSDPTTTTFPTDEYINTFCYNIEKVRAAAPSL